MAIYDDTIKKHKQYLKDAQLDAIVAKSQQYSRENAASRAEAVTTAVTNYDTAYRGLQNMGLAGRQGTQMTGEVPRLKKKIEGTFDQTNARLYGAEKNAINAYGDALAAQTKAQQAAQQVQRTVKTQTSSVASQPLIKGFVYSTDANMRTLQGFLKSNVAQVALGGDDTVKSTVAGGTVASASKAAQGAIFKAQKAAAAMKALGVTPVALGDNGTTITPPTAASVAQRLASETALTEYSQVRSLLTGEAKSTSVSEGRKAVETVADLMTSKRLDVDTRYSIAVDYLQNSKATSQAANEAAERVIAEANGLTYVSDAEYAKLKKDAEEAKEKANVGKAPSSISPFMELNTFNAAKNATQADAYKSSPEHQALQKAEQDRATYAQQAPTLVQEVKEYPVKQKASEDALAKYESLKTSIGKQETATELEKILSDENLLPETKAEIATDVLRAADEDSEAYDVAKHALGAVYGLSDVSDAKYNQLYNMYSMTNKRWTGLLPIGTDETKAGWQKAQSDRAEYEYYIDAIVANATNTQTAGMSKEQEDDDLSRYINDPKSFSLVPDFSLDQSQLQSSTQAKTNERLIYEAMTDEQRGAYNYIYQTEGEEAAHEYFDDLHPLLVMQRAQSNEDEWANLAKSHPVTAVIANALTVANSTSEIAPAVSRLGVQAYNDLAGTGKPLHIDTNSTLYDGTNMRSAVRSATSEAILGDTPGTGRQILNFAYQTGMSIADSAFVRVFMPVGLGCMSDVIFFSSSANEGYRDAMERGAAQSQAVALGTLNGVAEALFEHVSLENWWHAMETGNMKGLANLVRDVVVEGSEELCTDIANTLSDLMVMGDKASVLQTRDAYIQAGKSEKEATTLAVQDLIKQYGLSFLGGAVSGGFFHAASSIGMSKSNRRTGEAIQKVGGTQQVVNEAKLAGGTAGKLAQQYEGDYSANHVGEIYNTLQEQVAETVKTEEDLSTVSTVMEGKPINRKQAQAMLNSKEFLDNAGYETSSAEGLRNSYNQRLKDEKITAPTRTEGVASEIAARRAQDNQEIKRSARLTGEAKAARLQSDNEKISRQRVASVYRDSTFMQNAPALPTGVSSVNLAEASRQNFKAQSTFSKGKVEYQLSMMKTNSSLSAEKQLASARAKMTKEAQQRMSTIEKFADALGLDVVIHDVMPGASGFYGTDGKIHFTLDGNLNVARTIAHELTHKMKQDARTQYDAVRDQIIEDIGQERFEALCEKKAKEYGIDTSTEEGRTSVDDEVIAELCQDMLSDTEKLERFAGRHLEAFKVLRDKFIKILNAVKNALKGIGDGAIDFDQKTVDKWLAGLDAVLAKAEGRVQAEVTQEQETRAEETVRQEAEAETRQEVKAEQETSTAQEAKKGTVQELELAAKATRADVKSWKMWYKKRAREGSSFADASKRNLDRAIQREKDVETMLEKAQKGDALSSEEVATLDSIYDELVKEDPYGSVTEDWRAFREQAQQNPVGYAIDTMSGVTEQQRESFSADIQKAKTEAEVDSTINQYAVDVIRSDLDGYMSDLKASGLVGEGKAMSVKELEDLYNLMNEACDYVALHRAILDYGSELTTQEEIELAKASRLYTPVKENADDHYGVSLDYSTLCRKRILMQMISERLQQRLKRAILPEETVAIRREIQALQREGYKVEVACALCYVEAARNKSPKVINDFLKNPGHWLRNQVALTDENVKANLKAAQEAWKQEHYGNPKITKGEMTKPGATAKDYERTFKEWRQQDSSFDNETMRAIAMAIEVVKNSPEQLLSVAGLDNLKKSLDKVDQMIVNTFIERVRQATHSKAQESDTFWVRGDGQSIPQTLIDRLNLESGLRHQSWSDFQVMHTLDTMAMVIELSQRRAKEQAYTKVPDMVYLCGETGMMINMSLIPKGQTGMDANGNLIWDSTEGMDWDVMMKLRDMFPNTAGNIAIGVNDTQVKMLLASLDVDYVIPYHISGLNQKMRKLYEIQKWIDYTKKQEEKNNGRGKSGKKPMLYEWCNDKEGSKAADGYAYMRKASEKYLQLCYERNLVPKFAMYLTNNGDGSYSLNEEYANYWKLLVDRKMVNQQTGRVIEQKAVLPKFNRDTVMNMLTNAVNDPHAHDNEIVADKVVENLKDWDPNKNNASAEDVETLKAIEKKQKQAKAAKKATEAGDLTTTDAQGKRKKGKSETKKTQYSVERIGNTEFVRAEPDLFMNEDGSMKSETEIFNSLVGKVFRFPDGDVEIVKSLPGKDMQDELFRRFPSQDKIRGVKKVSRLNTAVNRNMEELVENSRTTGNQPDAGGRHAKQGIISFDTRSVNFYDGYRAYNVDFSIGVLKDGRKAAYAKRGFKYNKSLTEKIRAYDAKKQTAERAVRATDRKAVAPDVQPSKLPSSEPNQQFANKNKVPQPKQNVNTHFAVDSLGRDLSEGQEEYFGMSEVVDSNGRLMPVYHATDADFTVFNREYLGEMTDSNASSDYVAATAHLGFWFNTKDVSKEIWTDSNKTKEVYLNIENPYRTSWITLAEEMENEYADADMTPAEMGEAYRDELIRQGYDGIEAFDEEFGGTSYVIFDSNQAKSVDNQNPTSDADIRYALDTDLLRDTVKAIDTTAFEEGQMSLLDVNRLGLGVWLKDPSRIFDTLAGDDMELRNKLHQMFEKPHSDATGRYASNLQKMSSRVEQIALDAGALTVDKKGKKTFHEDVSAAIQNYGEGYQMKQCEIEARVSSADTIHIAATNLLGVRIVDKDMTLKELRKNFGRETGDYIWSKVFSEAEGAQATGGATEGVTITSETSPYTLMDLQRDFPTQWKAIVEADKQFRQMYEEYINDMNSMLEAIYPYAFTERDDTKDKLEKLMARKRKRIDETKSAIEERLKTLGAVEAEMASKKRKDTDAYDKLRNRKGRLEEKIADLKELQAGYEEDLAAIAAKKNYLQDMSKSGDSLERMHKLQYRRDYYHHFQELGQEPNLRKLLFGSKQTDISPAIVGKSDQSKSKSRWAGFFQQRKGDARKADAINGMLKYGTLAEYKLAFDPLVAYIRNAEQAVRDLSDEPNRNDMIVFLNNWGNAMAGKRQSIDRTLGEGNLFKTKLSQVVDWMQGRVISNTLSFSNRSSIVQISNIVGATSTVTDGRDWINGIRCWAKMSKGDTVLADIMDQSNFLKSRLTQVEYYDNSKMAKVEKFADWMLSIFDTISVKATWWAAYNQYVRDPSVAVYRAYDSAVDYADDVARRTHAGRGVGEKGDIFNSKFANFIAPFQLEVNNTWNLMKDNIKHKNARGIITMQATTFAMNVVFEQLVGSTLLPFDMIRALWDIVLGSIDIIDDDDDEDTRDDLGEIGKLAFQRISAEVLSGVPFSNILTFLVGEENLEDIFGETDLTRYGSDTMSGGAALSVAKDVASLGKWAITGEQPKWETLISDLASILPPIGGKQLARSVIGATTAIRGYSSTISGGEEKVQFATDGTIGEVIHAMLFGKWALPEAAEYTGEDRFVQQFSERVLGIKGNSASTGSLAKKSEFDSVRAIGLTGKEYFQLKEDLGEYSTQAGKRNWIYGMNLTSQQKAQLDSLFVTSADETKVSNTIVYARTQKEDGTWNDWQVKADYASEDLFRLSQMGNDKYMQACDAMKQGADIKKVLSLYDAMAEYNDANDKTMSMDEKRSWIRENVTDSKQAALLDAYIVSKSDSKEVKVEGSIVYTRSTDGASEWKVVSDYSDDTWYTLSQMGSDGNDNRYQDALTIAHKGGDAKKVLAYYEYVSDTDAKAEEKRDWIFNCGGSAEERATMDAILTRTSDEVKADGAIVYTRNKKDDGTWSDWKVAADYSSEIWYEISKTSYYDKAQKAYQSKGISPETSKKFFDEFSTLTATDANGKTVKGLKAERTWKLLNSLKLTKAQRQFLYDLCFKK